MIEEVIEIVHNLSYRFKPFGIYSREDIEQEMWLILLEPDKHGVNILSKFRPESGSLRSFLTASLINRVKNLRRDYYLKSNRKRPFNDAMPITPETHSLLTHEGGQENIADQNELRELCLARLEGDARMVFLKLSEGLEISPAEFRLLTSSIKVFLC